MATVERYVNSDGGSDSNGGTSTGDAWLTIAHALSVVGAQDPVTDDWIIRLAGTEADPRTYEEDVDFSALNVGTGSVTLTADAFDETRYQGGVYSPFDEANPWNPAELRYCTIDCVEAARCGWPIVIQGLAIGNDNEEEGPAVKIEDKAELKLVYCSVTACGGEGITVDHFATLELENCSIANVDLGVGCSRKSFVKLAGRNYLTDCGRFGIVALSDSHVSIEPWDDQEAFATTKIETATPRRNFAAVLLHSNSTLDLVNGPDEPGVENEETGFLHILNSAKYTSAGYYGVKLSAGSRLIGASSVYFTDPDSEETTDTIPSGQQIVGVDGQGVVVID